MLVTDIDECDVSNLVYTFDFSMLVSWWATTLWSCDSSTFKKFIVAQREQVWPSKLVVDLA